MLHIPAPHRSTPHRKRPDARKSDVRPALRPEAPIEAVQLARLAGAVLQKSPDDLMAIAECNPMIIWEWLEAFRAERQKAEQQARHWAAAEAALSTAIPAALRTAAE